MVLDDWLVFTSVFGGLFDYLNFRYFFLLGSFLRKKELDLLNAIASKTNLTDFRIKKVSLTSFDFYYDNDDVIRLRIIQFNSI